jgi:hypothetical protein
VLDADNPNDARVLEHSVDDPVRPTPRGSIPGQLTVERLSEAQWCVEEWPGQYLDHRRGGPLRQPGECSFCGRRDAKRPNAQ